MKQIWTEAERTQKPPHAKTRGWASILTSFAYLVPAYILLPSEWPASIAFVILTVGTLLFHATDNDFGLDGAGMLASVFVLVGLPYGAGEETAFGATGLLLRDFYNHKLVGILVVPVAAICLIHDAWPWLLGALALFAVGFLVWRGQATSRTGLVPVYRGRDDSGRDRSMKPFSAECLTFRRTLRRHFNSW